MAVSFVTRDATKTATASSYTWTAVSLGTAADDRIIVCSFNAEDAAAGTYGVSSATIGGVSATLIAQREDTVGFVHSYMVAAKVPTGTTGDITVTFVGNHIGCHLGVHRMVGRSSVTPFHTATDTADPLTMTLNVPQGGDVVATGHQGNSGTAFTTTGVTEDWDLSFDGNRAGGGSIGGLAAETGRTITFNGAGNGAGVCASWAAASLPPFSRPPRFMRRAA